MLTDEELETIKKELGRDPTVAEAATLDALWSEHCSYKSSKRWFHLFNTESDRVFLGIGEGAGLVDVGDGYLIGLGLESHNHPSAVDPFNGAATGVGGIIRDIVSQGCRPVAVLDCLRFGLPTTSRQKLLLDQVVLGISSYGNCVGIPNLGGDVEFAQEFTTNPLVNAMCIGVAHKDDIIRSIASNPGDKLLLFGSSSGRDGIGGVTFASEELDDSQQENRGSVQIGDPLTEKILIDAIMDLRDQKLLSGLQDLGGGGLVCAAVEMAEKGGTQVNLYLDKVPTSAENMKGWEILVSESQERMLAVIHPDNLDKAIQILEFYDLNWAVVGDIEEGDQFHGHFHDQIEASLPVDFTINGFPEPERVVGELPATVNIGAVSEEDPLEFLLSNFNVASRHPVYQQYDQHVQGNTVMGAERDSGVILLPNEKYLATAAGTNSYLVSLNPKIGAALATLSIMRKVVARGALPIAMVDSLNAGNPEKPSSYREFVDMIRGVAEISHELSIPVVGGNVSLYNESEQNGEVTKIFPSPFVGISGLIELDEPIAQFIQPEENTTSLYTIGANAGIMFGSEYGRYFGADDHLSVDYNLEKKLVDIFLTKAESILSATPVGKGGLLITLAKWSIQSNQGLTIADGLNEKQLFGENTPRYIVQLTSQQVSEFEKMDDIELVKVADLNSESLFKHGKNYKLSELTDLWKTPLENVMTG